jgi:hypothetical protein
LPKVLALAAYPNVAIKITVTCPKLPAVVTHGEALAETQKNGRNGSGPLFASAMVRT